MLLTRIWFKLMATSMGRKTVKGLYYIGGPDVLPQPLSREEEPGPGLQQNYRS